MSLSELVTMVTATMLVICVKIPVFLFPVVAGEDALVCVDEDETAEVVTEVVVVIMVVGARDWSAISSSKASTVLQLASEQQ